MSAQPPSPSDQAHVTPYDRYAWPADAIEAMLAAGEHERELRAYFGDAQYDRLAPIAKRARAGVKRGAMRVYILPGIMGSQLGLPRIPPLPADILWLDPIDIALGRLTALRMPAATEKPSRVIPLGVLLYTYLELRMRLRAAGFDAVFHDYDWRRPIDELGARFAERVMADPARRIAIVAHSLGGLVTRAAIAQAGLPRVERIVQLGAPNFGSYAPVQALRGTYSVVRKIATLDLRHGAEGLAQQVFSTFPSLYQMLPAPGRSGAIDLFDAAAWPKSGPQPDAALLTSGARVGGALAPADDRFRMIVGVDRDTVTGVAREGGDFRYTITRDGDGTVPLSLALLPGVPTRYARTQHGDLPRSDDVIAATADLLRTGDTDQLEATWATRREAARYVTDSQLRRTHREKVDWASLTPEERRRFLDTLNEPPPLPAAATASRGSARTRRSARARGSDRPGRAIPDGASGLRRLDVEIVRGDVADVDAEALVIAVFQGVRPSGAALAIDARLGGAIREFAMRRMLSGAAGSITRIPAAGALRHAKEVLVVGIGRFDRLAAGVVEFAAENVARYAARAGIARLATVLWGASAGLDEATSFEAQLRGYLRGLDAQPAGRAAALRRLIIAVRDAKTLDALRAATPSRTAALASRSHQLHFRWPESASRKAVGALPRIANPLAYLLVTAESRRGARDTWRSALLTSGHAAAVFSESQSFERAKFDAALRELGAEGLSEPTLARIGRELGELVLHPSLRELLFTMRDRELVVVHDDASSRMPWEALSVKDWSPAAERGLSRRYAAEQLSPARFNAQRTRDATLSVLLVANPTRDLPGAELEGDRVEALLRATPSTQVTVVRGESATRRRLLNELQSGQYDAVHYAGHAFFDPEAPERSGVVASDGVLAGDDLRTLAQLPALVVFNACESARVRRASKVVPASGAANGRVPERGRALRAGAGLAEAFLRAGVANYVGTYWPVGDAAAAIFAEQFYRDVLRAARLGDALQSARRAIRATHSVDWADYLHYGDPDFRLKDLDVPRRR